MKKGAHTKQGFVLKLIIQNEKSKVIIRNYMVNVSGSENEMVTSRKNGCREDLSCSGAAWRSRR